MVIVMFDKLFKKIYEVNINYSFLVNNHHYFKNASWINNLEIYANTDCLVFGVVTRDNEVIQGYANAKGFWYLYNDNLCLAKWTYKYSAISNYKLRLYVAGTDKYSTNTSFCPTVREFEGVLKLAEVAGLYLEPKNFPNFVPEEDDTTVTHDSLGDKT
jgi:hypothetical protein